jgi:hypothetical protein
LSNLPNQITPNRNFDQKYRNYRTKVNSPSLNCKQRLGNRSEALPADLESRLSHCAGNHKLLEKSGLKYKRARATQECKERYQGASFRVNRVHFARLSLFNEILSIRLPLKPTLTYPIHPTKSQTTKDIQRNGCTCNSTHERENKNLSTMPDNQFRYMRVIFIVVAPRLPCLFHNLKRSKTIVLLAMSDLIKLQSNTNNNCKKTNGIVQKAHLNHQQMQNVKRRSLPMFGWSC